MIQSDQLIISVNHTSKLLPQLDKFQQTNVTKEPLAKIHQSYISLVNIFANLGSNIMDGFKSRTHKIKVVIRDKRHSKLFLHQLKQQVCINRYSIDYSEITQVCIKWETIWDFWKAQSSVISIIPSVSLFFVYTAVSNIDLTWSLTRNGKTLSLVLQSFELINKQHWWDLIELHSSTVNTVFVY